MAKHTFHRVLVLPLPLLLLVAQLHQNVVAQPILSWSHMYGSSSNSDDFISSIAIDNDGNILACGVLDVNGFGGKGQPAIAAYTKDGVFLWDNEYISASATISGCVKVDSGGNVFVATNHYDSNSYTILTKLSPDGVQIWQDTLRFASDLDSPPALIVSAQGVSYLAGSDTYNSNSRVLLSRIETNGSVSWTREFTESANGSYNVTGIACDHDSVVYVGACAFQAGEPIRSVLLRYRLDGILDWSRDLAGSSINYFMSDFLHVDALGNAITIVRADAPPDPLQFIVTKHTPTGSPVWSRSLSSDSNGDYFGNIVDDDHGNVYVCSAAWPSWVLLTKLSASGALEWFLPISPGDSYREDPPLLALDHDGNILVLTVADNDGHGARLAIVRVAPTGDTLGTQFFTSSPDSCETFGCNDVLKTAAVSDEGYLIVGAGALASEELCYEYHEWYPCDHDWRVLKYWIYGSCPCLTDPVCDSLRPNVLDVVATIDVAFRNGESFQTGECLFDDADVNCDRTIDILDVVKTIEVAFRNADPIVAFCKP